MPGKIIDIGADVEDTYLKKPQTAMSAIIDDLSKLDGKQLENVYQEMQPTLEHNHRIYIEMTPEKVRSVFLK
jgi:hypothetical protein